MELDLEMELDWEACAAHLGTVLALAGVVPGRPGGFGYQGGVPPESTSVSVCHGEDDGPGADVQTADRNWPDEHSDGRLLSDWLFLVCPREAVTFPFTVSADRWEQTVDCAGTAVPFVFVGTPRHWCAIGQLGRFEIGVAGRDWPCDGLRLELFSPSR